MKKLKMPNCRVKNMHVVSFLFLLAACGYKSASYSGVELLPAPKEIVSDSVDLGLSKEIERIAADSTIPRTEVVQPKDGPHSKYFEIGYRRGYDDGEEDASNDAGWETSFDDDCRYKGQAKYDYEAGYEEGYHDGYDDNRDIEEDTDPDEFFL